RSPIARCAENSPSCARPARFPATLARPQLHAVAIGEQAMSVKVRPYVNGGWEVDITFRLPDGRRHRERKKAPLSSKSGALRWGQDRERHLLQHGPERPKKEVPTLADFAPRFLDGHARANRQKPGGIAHKESVLRVHLVPHFGAYRLDTITNEDVQRLKHALRQKSV